MDMYTLLGFFFSVYLSSLPVTHLSNAPRRRLVVTGNSARMKLLRAPPGSLTCLWYSTSSHATSVSSEKSHPKDN